MVKNANQEKNWTTPSLHMMEGIEVIVKKISLIALSLFSSFVMSSSGGYSEVVKIVYNILVKKTKAPTPNATLTDIGTTPGAATELTPISLTNQGKLLANHVPIPMIKVCTTKP